MSISQIRTITAFVDDQDRAKDFYVDVLGFAVRSDLKMGDNRWLEVAPGDSGTAIVLHRPFPGTTAGTLSGVILDSADLEADAKKLREAGVTVDGPDEMPWGKQATFADPDGNNFVLSAPSRQLPE
ncbi:VOC family protein [Rhodococcus sp. NPDC058521]|uniref:VOC family protein n=1 Tax=Rhodococcus sp. NPDC058521 TaxID=3346536 RepID=UPI00364B6816